MAMPADPYAAQKELYNYETPADTMLWINHVTQIKHICVLIPDYGWEFSDGGYMGRGAFLEILTSPSTTQLT